MIGHSDGDSNTGSQAPGYRLAVSLGLMVTLLWGGNLLLTYNQSYNARGTFGDMFGAVNSLFTGLAFAAVIFAIFLQKHEVRLLKSELAGTKKNDA